ncbi:nitrogen metabolite repression-(nmr)-responsible protein [Diplocarpon rosae]|nr:nitrogen metabolite repression-(nmr)-responsible protein [Diplocarpon rosae]
MPSAAPRTALAIRARPIQNSSQTSDSSSTPLAPSQTSSSIPQASHTTSSIPPSTNKLKHRPCTSYSELSSFSSHSQFGFSVQHPSSFTSISASANDRPSKRPMPTPRKTIAVVNASGRQAASFIRVASAVGYTVRAQLRNLDGIVASEISSLPNVKVLVGELYVQSLSPEVSASLGTKVTGSPNHELIRELYRGAQLAFVNTTFWGDEVALGKALADAAVTAGIEHYIYSSMPNHSLHNPSWPSLPLWSSKATIEAYIRSLPFLASRTTYLYTGIYNNNFTSLPYPLFCMEWVEASAGFEWTAPFHPDVPLPWLDAEHDVGPAVIQVFKDGISRWGNGERVALAYEMLSPVEACAAFSRGVGRPVTYRYSPTIEVKVKIPAGYRDQLLALEKMYLLGAADSTLQPPYFGSSDMERSCPAEALELWEGYRGLEEYAREVFPLEEAANGLVWMNAQEEEDGEGYGSEEEGSVMGSDTPARKEESWLA